jgi:hypothetical protein
MDSGSVIHVPNVMKIGSGVQRLIGGIHRHTHTRTATLSHKPTLSFQNKESGLIKLDEFVVTWLQFLHP